MSFQEELAVTLEVLRTEREKNAGLERDNTYLQAELDRALLLLYQAANPQSAQPAPEALSATVDEELPFVPDQE